MNAIEQKLKERRDKADGQLMLVLNGLFYPLVQVANLVASPGGHNWTRDVFVVKAKRAILVLADQYYRRRCGEDVAIQDDTWNVNGTVPRREKR